METKYKSEHKCCINMRFVMKLYKHAPKSFVLCLTTPM